MYTFAPIGSTDPLEDAAWRKAADAIAVQYRALYVNRTDRYGGYRRHRKAGSSDPWEVGTVTLPENSPFPDVLLPYLRTHALNAGQYRPLKTVRGVESQLMATIGVHVTSARDTCKFIRIDLDAHTDDAETPARNVAAAAAWMGKLQSAGFNPWLWDSNGVGGLWIDVFFAAPVPSQMAFAFGQWVIEGWQDFGFASKPEAFPKQPTVSHLAKKLGHWVRLPGMHHKRGTWCRLWSGTCWLGGADAVARFLAAKGDDPNLIPKQAKLDAEILMQPDRVVTPRPGAKRTPFTPTDAEIGERRLAGCCRVVGSRSVGDRNDMAEYLGSVGKEKNLPFDTSLRIIRDWNSGNVPPLGGAELEDCVSNGYKYGGSYKRVETPRPVKPKAPLPLPAMPPKPKDPARTRLSKGVSETPTPTPDSDSSSSSLPLEERVRAADSSEDSRPLCRNGRPLLVEGVGRHEGNNKVIRPSCNRWSCPECNNRMRELRKEELVPAVMRCESPIAVWEGGPKEFAPLREHLKRLTGSPPRVCTVKLDEDRMFAVFLDAPDSPRINRVEPAAAGRLLTTALDLFLVVQGSKAHPFRPINVSKNFLPPDRPPRTPQQWRRVGPTKLSLDEIVKLLTDRGVFANATDFESVYPVAGGRPVSLITWSYPAGMPLEEQADINRAIVTGVIDRERPFQLSDLDDVAERLLAAAVRREAAPSRPYVVEVASPPPSLSRVEERGAGAPLPADVIRWRYADEGSWRTPKA